MKESTFVIIYIHVHSYTYKWNIHVVMYSNIYINRERERDTPSNQHIVCRWPVVLWYISVTPSLDHLTNFSQTSQDQHTSDMISLYMYILYLHVYMYSYMYICMSVLSIYINIYICIFIQSIPTTLWFSAFKKNTPIWGNHPICMGWKKRTKTTKTET